MANNKQILNAILKALLAGANTSAWVKIPATLIVEIAAIPKEKREVLVDTSKTQQFKELLDQEKISSLNSAYAAANTEQIKTLLCNLNKLSIDQTNELTHLTQDLFNELIESIDGIGTTAKKTNALVKEINANTKKLVQPFSITHEELLSRNMRYLESFFRKHKYYSSHDVRKYSFLEIIHKWTDHEGVTISGESGYGKSWALYSIASYLIDQNKIVILIDNQKGASLGNEREASRVFFHDILNNDSELYLDRISELLLKAGLQKEIFLLIDGVNDFLEAKYITSRDWESWGIKIAISSLPYAVIEADGWYKHTIDGFCEEELQEYLDIRLRNEWLHIPTDVRRTLKIPLLAQIYCDIYSDCPKWEPSNEYELYAEYWSRLTQGEMSKHAKDRSILKQLAYNLLNNATYPWRDRQISQFGPGGLIRLEKCGWLRNLGDGKWGIIHDRLLNWLVAEAIIEKVSYGELDNDRFLDLVDRLWKGTEKYSCGNLGYVPLDLLYLMLKDTCEHDATIKIMIEMLDSDLFLHERKLYNYYLPSFGKAVLPFLFNKLRGYCCEGNCKKGYLFDSLEYYEHRDICKYIDEFINDESPLVKRAAIKILGQNPSGRYLDQIWQIHCDMQKNYKKYSYEYESGRYFVYNDSFGALKACLRLNTEWLEKAIQESKPQEPVADLAYLLASSGDKRIWQKCKNTLFEKVKADKARCLANCISVFRDDSHVDWLRDRIHIKEDSLGDSALRALAKISQKEAVSHLKHCEHIYFCRGWHIHLLLKLVPSEAKRELLGLMQSSTQPWQIARFYQGSENEIDSENLDYLLDQLEEIIDEVSISPPEKQHPLWFPLDCLSKLWSIDQLDCFRKRKGGTLEKKLTKWLLEKGGRLTAWVDHELFNAVNILYKIGGDGIILVVKNWLASNNFYMQRDGLGYANKVIDVEIVDLLKRLSASDKLEDIDYPFNQGEATFILENIGENLPVVNYLLKWGMKCSGNICEYCAGDLDSYTFLQPAIDVLKSYKCETEIAGAVIALGGYGQTQYINQIFNILCDSEKDSDLAHACIITLGKLRAEEDKIVNKLCDLYSNSKFAHSISLALLRINSSLAQNYLLETLDRKFDFQIAYNLISNDVLRDQVLQYSKKHLRDANFLNEGFIYSILLHYVDLGGSLKVLFDKDIKELLLSNIYDTRFLCSKRNQIELYSHIDKNKAWMVAKRDFENTNMPARNSLPELMAQIDAEKSIDYLFKKIVQEKDVLVQWAIGRVLANSDLIQSHLDSKSKNEIIAALRISGWNSISDIIYEDIKSCLLDGDSDIENEALNALDRISRFKELNKVIGCLVIEEDMKRKWLLLDAALNLGDPGDDSTGSPQWIMDIQDKFSLPMRIYADEELKKKKKELKDRAKKLSNK